MQEIGGGSISISVKRGPAREPDEAKWRVLAEEQAARDRDTLARLTEEKKVVRSGPPTALTRDIEARLRSAKPSKNLAIRPKKKGKRRA